MKLLTVLLAQLLVCCLTSARSQYRASVGVVAGVNIADVYVSPPFVAYNSATERSAREGVVAGLDLHVPVGSLFFIRTGLFYAEKGVEIAFPLVAGGKRDGIGDYKFTYVELPLHVGLSVNFGSTGLFGIVGPNFGMNISATGDFSYAGRLPDTTYDYNTTIQPIDFAVDIGGGISQNIDERFWLMVEVRYSHGVLDIDRAAGSMGEEDWWSRDVKITMGGFYQL